MNKGRTYWAKCHRIGISLLIMVLVAACLCFNVSAKADRTDVVGKVFSFNADSHYEFSESNNAETSDTQETYGEFYVTGNISGQTEKDGVPSFIVGDGELSLYYCYSDELLNAGLDEWHLVDDKSKKVDSLTLDNNIMKGAIAVQTSKDRINWVDMLTSTNSFSEKPVNTEPIYNTQDIQLINGCYYRVIIAYETSRRIEKSSILFVSTDKYEYSKHAEVYEFYACRNENPDNSDKNAQTYNIGSAVRVNQYDGYYGEKPIVDGDPHYGITIGQFFVSGYTAYTNEDSDSIVFLKNVGDKVTLWFKLNENIDAVNGSEKVKVTADTNGHDQYFQTPPTDFGRGALIVKSTDYNNNSVEPQIYANYLEANASVSADTKVSLFEEGDYEIALDYQITEDKLIDTVAHYRIFFRFSIRNGNCMVYPFDLRTGNELTNSSMTENGFRLDLAKSRYLKVNVKREIMADSADGLVEDVRFNGPAKDGAEYKDDGIYTITVSNQYTNQFTVKKIYVGTNDIMRAYMTTGLSIPEINNLVADGATINNDGTIKLADGETAMAANKTDADGEIIIDTAQIDKKTSHTPLILILIIAAIVLAAAGAAVFYIIRKKRSNDTVEKGESEK